MGGAKLSLQFKSRDPDWRHAIQYDYSATWDFVSLGLCMTASTSYGSVDVTGVAEVRPVTV